MSFDVAASAYDAFTGRWSRLLSPALADLAEVRPAMRVLDGAMRQRMGGMLWLIRKRFSGS